MVLYMVLVQWRSFQEPKGILRYDQFFIKKMHRVEAIYFCGFCVLRAARAAIFEMFSARFDTRAVLEKFRAIQMVDVHLPTTDGRTIIFRHISNPSRNMRLC